LLECFGLQRKGIALGFQRLDFFPAGREGFLCGSNVGDQYGKGANREWE
jgi:hypothetical protein